MRRFTRLWLAVAVAAGAAGTGCALDGTPDVGGVGGAGSFLEETVVTVGAEETPVETLTLKQVEGVNTECAGVWRSIDGWHPALVSGTGLAAIVDAHGVVVCVDDAAEVTRSIAAEYGADAASDFVWLVIESITGPIQDPTPQPAAMGGVHDPTPQPASDGEVEDPTPQPAREIQDPTPQPASH